MCRADMRHWPPHSFRADRQPLGSFEALDMSIGLACAQKSFSGSFDLNQRDLQCVIIFCGCLGGNSPIGDHR